MILRGHATGRPVLPDSIIIFYLITSLKNIYYQWFNFPGNLLPDRASVKASVGGTVRGEGTIIFGLRAISPRNSHRFPHPGMLFEPATLASSNYVARHSISPRRSPTATRVTPSNNFWKVFCVVILALSLT